MLFFVTVTGSIAASFLMLKETVYSQPAFSNRLMNHETSQTKNTCGRNTIPQGNKDLR